MSDADPHGEALRKALHELANQDAPGVLERARARALARAERLIEDILVQDLLAAAAGRSRPRPRAAAGDLVPEVNVAGADNTAGEGATAIEGAASELWWAYCILREPDATLAADALEGIEPGTPVEMVSQGDLAALISSVPLVEYGDERLREHLEDLAWVERTARRHENVLEAALGYGTIVPLRLCTLFRDREGVSRLLRDHRGPLVEGLARVDGCVEWGVKVFSDPRASNGADGSAPETAEGRGATYLLRRQHERALSEKASEVRARCVELVHQGVAALARASRTNPPQRPEVHGRELTMLLNGAYLIERDRSGELHGVIDALQEDWSPLGFAIELTGPWPPYNFVAGAAGVMS